MLSALGLLPSQYNRYGGISQVLVSDDFSDTSIGKRIVNITCIHGFVYEYSMLTSHPYKIVLVTLILVVIYGGLPWQLLTDPQKVRCQIGRQQMPKLSQSESE